MPQADRGHVRLDQVQAGFAKVKVRTQPKVEAVFTFAAVAYNLIRIPKLLAKAPA